MPWKYEQAIVGECGTCQPLSYQESPGLQTALTRQYYQACAGSQLNAGPREALQGQLGGFGTR
jgi:hypothetical protein